MTLLTYLALACAIFLVLSTRRIGFLRWEHGACQLVGVAMFLLGRLG